MGIIVKNIPVEAQYFINMVEHYYKPLRQVYSIIIIKISGIQPNLVLEISFKAINNLVGPNRLVFTPLIYSTYPKKIKQDASSPSMIQCAVVIQKAMNENLKYTISQRINDIFNT